MFKEFKIGCAVECIKPTGSIKRRDTFTVKNISTSGTFLYPGENTIINSNFTSTKDTNWNKNNFIVIDHNFYKYRNIEEVKENDIIEFIGVETENLKKGSLYKVVKVLNSDNYTVLSVDLGKKGKISSSSEKFKLTDIELRPYENPTIGDICFIHTHNNSADNCKVGDIIEVLGMEGKSTIVAHNEVGNLINIKNLCLLKKKYNEVSFGGI